MFSCLQSKKVRKSFGGFTRLIWSKFWWKKYNVHPTKLFVGHLAILTFYQIFAVLFLSKKIAPENSVNNLEANALDSRTINVSWQAPLEHTHNGPLKGYYVQYRRLSNDQVLYKTLELGDDQRPASNLDESTGDSLTSPLSIILTNLKPFTEYLISIRPFNLIGTGPVSSPISIRTLEDGKCCFFFKKKSFYSLNCIENLKPEVELRETIKWTHLAN